MRGMRLQLSNCLIHENDWCWFVSLSKKFSRSSFFLLDKPLIVSRNFTLFDCCDSVGIRKFMNSFPKYRQNPYLVLSIGSIPGTK